MRKLRVLVACEESQTVCKAFRALGHEAYSCDIQECSGGHPEWHFQEDIFKVLEREPKFDLMVAHPPCTYLSRAGARWLYVKGNINQGRYENGLSATQFFLKIMDVKIEHICIENPTPLQIWELPEHSQVIQPYEHGHKFSKRTLLWLKNLPELKPTKIENEYTPLLPSNTGGNKRGQKATFRNISKKESSKTFSGIADAMASQWSEYILTKIND